MVVESMLLAASLFFCQTQAYQGEDMDDEDFSLYVQAHDNFRETYGENAARGCVAGAVKDGLKGGFQALCIGCATGAAAGVALQMTFSDPKEK